MTRSVTRLWRTVGLAVFLGGVIAAPWTGWANPLSPSAYEAMQEAAPIVVEIEVLKVQREPTENLQEEMIRVTAVVVRVEKGGQPEKAEAPSESKIAAGDFLQIAYTVQTREDGRVGREQIPVLEEGQTTIAFLQSVEGVPHLQPAAGAMSFSKF